MTWFDAFLRTCDIEKHRQFFVTEESTDLASMKEWTDRDLDVLGINKSRRMKIVEFLKIPDTMTEAVGPPCDTTSNTSATTFLAASKTIIQTVHVMPFEDSVTVTVDQIFNHKLQRLDHFLSRVSAHDKKRGSRQKSGVLLFTNQRATVDKVFEHLKQGTRYTTASKGERSKGNYGVAMLHGQLPQDVREQALRDFKAGKVTVLVTTDIAARGLDVEKLPFVLNFDMPRSIEVYVHRIGRTGRSGNVGVAETLFVPSVDRHLTKLLINVLTTCSQKVPKDLAGLR